MNFKNKILFYDNDVEFQKYLNYRVDLILFELETWDELDLKNRFRLSKETVMMILNMIGSTIASNTDR